MSPTMHTTSHLSCIPIYRSHRLVIDVFLYPFTSTLNLADPRMSLFISFFMSFTSILCLADSRMSLFISFFMSYRSILCFADSRMSLFISFFMSFTSILCFADSRMSLFISFLMSFRSAVDVPSSLPLAAILPRTTHYNRGSFHRLLPL